MPVNPHIGPLTLIVHKQCDTSKLYTKYKTEQDLLADDHFCILNQLICWSNPTTHTCTDTHNVFKFRKQLCWCTKQTDGQTDCQPHRVSVYAWLLVFISYSYSMFIFWESTCCCPVLSSPDRHGGNQHSGIFVNRREGRSKRIEREEWFTVFIWFFFLFQKLVSLTGESVWEGGWWKRWRRKGGLRGRKIEKTKWKEVIEKMSFTRKGIELTWRRQHG